MNNKYDAETDMAVALIELGKIAEISTLLASERAKIAQVLLYARYVVTKPVRMTRQAEQGLE